MANEKRLIDADALEQFIADNYGYPAVDILHEISTFPTVEAVEVVRCKDCVYAKNNYLVHGLCLCEKQMHHVVHGDRPKNALMCEDDFCSYGERRCGDGLQTT